MERTTPKDEDDLAKTIADEPASPMAETIAREGEALTRHAPLQTPTRHAPLKAPDTQDDQDPASVATLELDVRRYVERSLLGRGGMGEVHLCEDRWIGRDIAMKVMLGDAKNQGALARFVREAKVQARLEHPSIVPVYDIGVRDDGTVWFTMKRIRGRSLEEILWALAKNDTKARAEYSRRKLLQSFVAVCYAIAFAHERGVVHRDLKPGNIMLGAFGEVSVLDWGIARIDGASDDSITSKEMQDLTSGQRETAFGSAIGTPGYMAPEQARGERDRVGPHSDVYALGAILFEILALQPLVRGSTGMEVLMAGLKEIDGHPSNRGADVAPELDEICHRATLFDPEKRMQSAKELAESVEKYLDGDRDIERRRQLSSEYAQRAVEHLEKKDREGALVELGRAVAIDPQNATARDMMAQLMLTVPAEIPAEARAELEIERGRARREAARAGAMRYMLWSGFSVLGFWMGILNWSMTVLILSVMFGAGVWAMWMSARTKPGTRSMLALLVLSSLAIGLTSGLFGAFIIVPALAATNAMYFAMSMPKEHRPWVMLASAAAIVLPLALDLGGLVPSAYVLSTGDALTVKARVTWFPEIPTMITLLVTSVAMIVIPVIMVGRMRDALTRAEERIFLQAWQLRATLPSEARAPLVAATGKRLPRATP